MSNTQIRNGRSSDATLALSATGQQPVWMTLNIARERAFTGEVIFELDPEVRAYLDNGVVYYAERASDTSLGRRLVEAGVIDTEQLERGTVRVGGVEHLGRLFDRDPSVDRDAVLVVAETATDDLIADLANREITTVRATAYRHHPSGVHRWFVGPSEPALNPPPIGEVAQIDSTVTEDIPGLPISSPGMAEDVLTIEWDEPLDMVSEDAQLPMVDEFDTSMLEAMLNGDVDFDVDPVAEVEVFEEVPGDEVADWGQSVEALLEFTNEPDTHDFARFDSEDMLNDELLFLDFDETGSAAQQDDAATDFLPVPDLVEVDGLADVDEVADSVPDAEVEADEVVAVELEVVEVAEVEVGVEDVAGPVALIDLADQADVEVEDHVDVPEIMDLEPGAEVHDATDSVAAIEDDLWETEESWIDVGSDFSADDEDLWSGKVDPIVTEERVAVDDDAAAEQLDDADNLEFAVSWTDEESALESEVTNPQLVEESSDEPSPLSEEADPAAVTNEDEDGGLELLVQTDNGDVVFDMPVLTLDEDQSVESDEVPDDVADAVRRAIAAIESATMGSPSIAPIGDPASPDPVASDLAGVGSDLNSSEVAAPKAPPAESAFAGFAPPTQATSAEVMYSQLAAEQQATVAPDATATVDADADADSGDGPNERESALRRLIGSLRRKDH